jgi:hypothetical protein
MDFKFTDLEIPDDSPEGRLIEEIMTRDNVSATEALQSVIRAAVAERSVVPARHRRPGPVWVLENPEDMIGAMRGMGIVEIAEEAIQERETRHAEDR